MRRYGHSWCIDALFPSATAYCFRGCRDAFHRARRRGDFRLARTSGGSGVGLSSCGGDGRAAWPADADAARVGARLLHHRRYSARYRGDAGHAARRDDLAREHRAVDCRLAHHDAGDVELPAHRAPLGSIVGADGGKSGLDGPSHRAVERTGRRPACHCHRADCARSPARRRPAERTGAVRTGGTGGGAGARACRLLRARSDAAARGGLRPPLL